MSDPLYPQPFEAIKGRFFWCGDDVVSRKYHIFDIILCQILRITTLQAMQLQARRILISPVIPALAVGLVKIRPGDRRVMALPLTGQTGNRPAVNHHAGNLPRVHRVQITLGHGAANFVVISKPAKSCFF